MSTYRNGFHSDIPGAHSAGPREYSTNALPIAHRGFMIYPRVPYCSRTKYGENDAVIGGAVIMMTCTVEGAKQRIDDLLDNPEAEDRAREKMRYLRAAEAEVNVPTLFDELMTEAAA